MVFLCLYPYKKSSLKLIWHEKLDPNFYGPYKVLQTIGSVAYKLELPPSSRIHPVFHVSCLKKVIGTNIKAQTVLPETDKKWSIILEPKAILNKHTCHLLSRSITKVFNSVAQHATKGCYMGTTPSYSATISTSKALRKKNSKREGC